MHSQKRVQAGDRSPSEPVRVADLVGDSVHQQYWVRRVASIINPTSILLKHNDVRDSESIKVRCDPSSTTGRFGGDGFSHH